jgi:hypothetical protein
MMPLSQLNFKQLGENIIKGLQDVLGDKFSTNTREGWKILYSMLATRIQERMSAHNQTVGYEIGHIEAEKTGAAGGADIVATPLSIPDSVKLSAYVEIIKS